MTPVLILMTIVVVTALAFDFTNGFHDTANAMATSIATKALKPKAAVTLCAVLNLVGAFLSVEVALTVTTAVIRIQTPTGGVRPDLVEDGGFNILLILLSGLAGAIIWNILTWLWGLPSSSSHALFGGLVGATIAGLGIWEVKWLGEGSHLDGVLGKVVLPALASPFIAMCISAIGTRLVFALTSKVEKRLRDSSFRLGQIGTASLLSLSHGTNDAQKTMGMVTLALIAGGQWHDLESIPFWVKIACAVAIALGTYIGGWRIIRTMGHGLVKVSPRQGFSAEAASAAVILTSSQMGFALSTTHVATGSILGTGLGVGAKVQWSVAKRMVLAWLTTLPLAGVAGAIMYLIGHFIGGEAGSFTVFGLICVSAGAMFLHSRRDKVNHENLSTDDADDDDEEAN